MWHAHAHRKLHTVLADGGAWDRVVARSEDVLTSLVFGRLAYLSDEALEHLLLRASTRLTGDPPPALGALLHHEPWPRLRKQDDARREPDWLFRFAHAVVVIEAKWGDTQHRQQLIDQLEAVRRRFPQAPIVQVAVGPDSARTWQDLSRPLDVPCLRRLSWSRIASWCRSAFPGAEPRTQRLLGDLLAILASRGQDARALDTLPRFSLPEPPAPWRSATPDWPDARIPALDAPWRLQ